MPLCSHDSYPCKARFALCFVCYRHIYSVSYSISTTPELTSKAYGNRPTSRGTASLRHSEVPGDIAVPLPIRFGDFQNPRGQTPIKDVPTLRFFAPPDNPGHDFLSFPIILSNEFKIDSTVLAHRAKRQGKQPASQLTSSLQDYVLET
jgi:hypothetical protein